MLVVALGWWALEAAWEQPTAVVSFGVAAITAAAMHTLLDVPYGRTAAGLIVVVAGRRPYGRIKAVRSARWPPVWRPSSCGLRSSSTNSPRPARPGPHEPALTEIFIETLQGIGGNNRFEGESLGVLLGFVAVLGLLAIGPARDKILQVRSSIHPSVQVPAAAGLGLGLGAAAAVATGGAPEARYAAIAIPFILLLAGRGVAMLDTRAWSSS